MLLGALFFCILAGAAFAVIVSLPDRPMKRKSDIIPFLIVVLIPAILGGVFWFLALKGY